MRKILASISLLLLLTSDISAGANRVLLFEQQISLGRS